jgi:predicted metal-dependent peptidase
MDMLVAAKIRVSRRSPFFGALALYVEVREDLQILHFEVDDQVLWVNPHQLAQLSRAEVEFWLVHAVLHAALQHPQRLLARDKPLWNLACDIVVNGMIAAESARLHALGQPGYGWPAGAVRAAALEKLSAEEVYAALQRHPQQRNQCCRAGDERCDLRAPACEDGSGAAREADDLPPRSPEFWPQAVRMARLLDGQRRQGADPLADFLDMQPALGLGVPWQNLLWRYLVPRANDYREWDCRFIADEVYLEELHSDALHLHVCIDTSGSISGAERNAMLGEVEAIAACHPQVHLQLWYADTRLHGPYPVRGQDGRLNEPLPQMQGGGGTDFRPFFGACADLDTEHVASVAVYMTDGFGSFPERAPDVDTLWVVPAGGAANDHFPFGRVIRQA